MQLGSTSAIRCLERGCPQGSVSGPIFWNIIINDLLSKLNNLACCEIIAFADDILVCSQGRDISETFLHAQEALNFASDWSKSFKLEFNPYKTRFMATEKRNVCCDAFQLYLDGTPFTMVKQMKYLGVLLDTKFSWKEECHHYTVQFSDKSTEDFPVICYTDGSKIDGRVGFAFVVFRSGVESENFQFRIRDECTVFVAELLCLNFAVKWITEQNSVISEYLICTDSLSSLDSLKCISSPNNTIVEIQKQLKSLRDKNISIDFAFVRGHTGVLGNERADWLAKAATKRKIDIDVNIPKSFYKKITNERMMKSWNQEYLISNKGSITKKIFPTINKRLSCHHFYTNYKLTQFLTGHGNFKSYLNKFNLGPSSFCDCNIGGEENVEHVILLCYKYVRERKIIRLAFKRLNINWPPNFHQFLSTRSAFNNFCKFVVTVCNPS
ncbi:retrovirus-related Pol polyprotein from type-1 retrotransposable element R1 [Trichonephila clavipes]|nr:retrovirus-related Pol polyprotein from type-1 retrotransposable element R1 [Trichonephila clavipes]